MTPGEIRLILYHVNGTDIMVTGSDDQVSVKALRELRGWVDTLLDECMDKATRDVEGAVRMSQLLARYATEKNQPTPKTEGGE